MALYLVTRRRFIGSNRRGVLGGDWCAFSQFLTGVARTSSRARVGGRWRNIRLIEDDIRDAGVPARGRRRGLRLHQAAIRRCSR